MSETALNSLADYQETLQLIKRKISNLTDAQIKWKPAADAWSIQEIVAHLVDSSLVHSIRIRKIVAESNEPFMLYKQDAWVASSKSNEAELSGILSALDAVVVYNVAYYDRLSVEDWHKKALSEGKEFTITDLFHGFIRHVQIHLAQIDRNIARFSTVS